jgi:2,4-dienoyl-CoA reductase-like NADH-dependent reductase (Old Yellow Enzyme family)
MERQINSGNTVETANVFSPLTIREITLKNRIVVSPMQQYSSVDGFATDWHLVHLGSRAVGGAGLIITECASVNPLARSTSSDIGIWKDDHIAKWQQINAFIHEQGAATAMQLGHFGSKASRSHPNEGFGYLDEHNNGWQTVSSSPIAPFPGMSIPKELSIEEISEIIKDFQNAALRAVKAGFDIIELHFAHGYLVHQFLSKLINQRNDLYGGSFENRTRLGLEIVDAVRQAIPKEMPLFVRISAVDYVESEDAWTLEESIQFARLLKEKGVDLITASAGGFSWVDKSKLSEGYQVPLSQAIKAQTGMLTGSVGLITKAQTADEIIQNGNADLVIIAREHLRNPYFAINAGIELELPIDIPWQYKRAY